jgi:hypothetical protein
MSNISHIELRAISQLAPARRRIVLDMTHQESRPEQLDQRGLEILRQTGFVRPEAEERMSGEMPSEGMPTDGVMDRTNRTPRSGLPEGKKSIVIDEKYV